MKVSSSSPSYGPLIDIGVNLTVEEFAPDVDGIIDRAYDAGQSYFDCSNH